MIWQLQHYLSTLELIENNYQGDAYVKYEIISQLGEINALLGKYGELNISMNIP